MKRLFLVIFLSAISVLSLSAQVKWMDFEEAVKQNSTDPKPILVDVYAEWCGPCKMMDKNTFNDPATAKIINEYFHPVKLNAESKDPIRFGGHTYTFDSKNRVHQLAIAILQGKMAYPSIAYMDETNQLLTIVPGYQKPDDIKPILKYFGEGFYKTLAWNDYLEKVKNEKL